MRSLRRCRTRRAQRRKRDEGPRPKANHEASTRSLVVESRRPVRRNATREGGRRDGSRGTDACKGVRESFSQSYLSQIESGTRPHLTHNTRLLLSRFFKVHPGYLVTDPPGYHTELTSALRTVEGRLDNWLIKGAEQFGGDLPLREAILRLAQHDDSRKCLLLLGTIVETPHLVDRLLDALNASPAAPPPAAEGAWVQ